jgi:hypothetical protein
MENLSFMSRRIAFILLFVSSGLAFGQAYLPVSGSRVNDNQSQPLTGQVRFTVTDTSNLPITYTPQGGSSTNATITVNTIRGVVQNTGGFPPTIPNPDTMSPANSRYRIEVIRGQVLLTFPLVQITGRQNFSLDGYIIPQGVTASGQGMPQWPCSPGATYNDVNGGAPYPWVCSQLSTDNSIVWTQNPSLNPMCQKGNSQAIGSPINASGPPFCLAATIAWATPGYVYAGPTPASVQPGQIGLVPISQLCAGGACGTGGNPGDNLQEIQANKNGTAFQGSGSYTDANRTLFFQPSVNAPSRSSTCGGRQCGFVQNYGQNGPIKNGSNVDSGWGQSFYNYRNGLWTGLAYFNGYNSTVSQGTEPPGGSATSMQSDTNAFHMQAIMQDIVLNNHAGKPYDTANIYSYLLCHGGYWGGGDEGCTNLRINGGNDSNQQGAIIVSGTPAPGDTTVNYSNAFHPDDIFVGGFMIDIASPSIYTGNITAYDPTQHLLTVSQPAPPLGTGAITVPTSAGTTTGAITIVDADIQASNGVGVSKTVPVRLDTGSAFSPTAVTLLVCVNPTWEFVVPTSFVFDSLNNVYNLTATFQHGHPAGCYVQQGGTWGIADLQADRINNAILNAWRTDYFVYGATDATHIHEATWITGARGVINQWRHNFGGFQNHLVNTAQVTGSGTTVKFCGLGQSGLNFASSYVKVSNATPSAYNGIYNTGPMDSNLCTSAPGTATGPVTAATLDVGGDVNSQDGNTFGPGGFTIWPTARIKQLGTSIITGANGVQTVAYNNTLLLYPNNMTQVAGHIAVVLDDMQSKVEPLSALGTVDTAPTQNTNNFFQSIVSGYGVTTTSFIGGTITNNNPFSWYKGGGTCTIPGGFCLDPAIGLNVGGPWGYVIRAQQPVSGGTILEGYPSPMAAGNVGNNTHFFLRDDGPGGNAGFYVSYNPNTGISLIGSGKGDGVQSAFTMTPTDMTFSATGSMTFQTATFSANALQGVGTRCLHASSGGQITPTSADCGVVTGIVPIANGGNGTATPALTAGANVTITGTWPNYTIASTGGGGGTGVPSVNGVTGAVTIAAGAGINVGTAGSTITITNTASGGTVTSFSKNDTSVAPLFTQTVTNSSTTPLLTSTLAAAGPHAFFGNCSGTTGTPNYCQPSFADISGTIAAGQLPLATTSAFGAVKCDGITITCTSGVITAIGGGIGGLTIGKIPVATSSTAIGDGPLDTTTNAGAVTSSQDIYAPSVHVTGNGAFGFSGAEGVCSLGTSGQDGLCADSTAHRLVMNNNNSGTVKLVGIGTAATSGHIAVFSSNGYDIQDLGSAGITASGSSCTITAMIAGVITGATCTP